MISKESVLKEVQESYGEWLEMSDDPKSMIADILSQKVVSLSAHIIYLERRLEYANSTIH